jgi:transcriptional regulator with XRE-family HTH domain
MRRNDRHPPLVNLRALRRAQELTQGDLAKRAKPRMSPGHISFLERGLGCPPATRARLARALGVSESDLIEQKNIIEIAQLVAGASL